MIPRDYITSWRIHAPWATDAQVEQDLVVSRALVELFGVPDLAGALAFRGGTVDSRWFGGSAEVGTYTLDELLGTRLRALHQRKKGRDLFDLWHALETGRVDVPSVIASFAP